jgi:hypothetical protein
LIYIGNEKYIIRKDIKRLINGYIIVGFTPYSVHIDFKELIEYYKTYGFKYIDKTGTTSTIRLAKPINTK